MDVPPKLELDWEVGLFRALRSLWRWIRPDAEPPYVEGRAALLAPNRRRLEILAQLVAGGPVRVVESRGEGGLRGDDILLPPFIDILDDVEANGGLYVLRTVLTAGVWRLRPLVPVDETSRRRHELMAVRKAVQLLSSELSRFDEAWCEACSFELTRRPDPESLAPWQAQLEAGRQSVLCGRDPVSGWNDKLGRRGEASPVVTLWGALFLAETKGDAPGHGEGEHTSLPDGTEVEAPAVEDLQRVFLDPKAQEEKTLMHSFEKVETADSFDGNVRKADGSDELEDQLEALEEVDLGQLVRDGTETHSVLKAEVGFDAGGPDVAGTEVAGIPYDEWDGVRRRYRKGWCTVVPGVVARQDHAWAQRTLARHHLLVERLVKQLMCFRANLRPLGRQLDGEHPDIEALVDHRADVVAGRSGSDRLYIRQGRPLRDVATTVLLDVSLSSDSWVADRRVLDVSREAALVLGEVAHRLGDQLEVLAFSSATRNQCHVWTVKGRKESWLRGRARLGALEPQGYTRIGAALRHATAGLAGSGARHKLLLMVSDGRPTDVDRYEGRYGEGDVRMALREARRQGVSVQALAIDTSAHPALPTMLGTGCWHLLPTPDRLLDCLTQVYGRATSW